MALEELTSEWGRELNLQSSVLKGPWRGKRNLDELLICEVRIRVKPSVYGGLHGSICCQ